MMLDVILGSTTRERLLSVLFADPTAQLHLRELVRRVGTGVSGIQRELERLESVGLITTRHQGRERHVAVNTDHPLYPELLALVRKAEGLSTAGEPSAIEARLNPRIRPLLIPLVESCKRHRVSRLSVFGSSTQAEAGVVPGDVDILIRFDEDTPNRFDEYFDLKEELERIMGMPVDIVEEGAIRNPYLRDEIERTRVDVYAAA
jgi:predicted nucleotidyltransferase